MSRHMPPVSGDDAVAAFRKVGFCLMSSRGKGSHMVLGRLDDPVQLTIPKHKELKAGTLRSLIRNAGLTVEAFRNLL